MDWAVMIARGGVMVLLLLLLVLLGRGRMGAGAGGGRRQLLELGGEGGVMQIVMMMSKLRPRWGGVGGGRLQPAVLT